MTKNNRDKNMFSDHSDHELIEEYQNAHDPSLVETLKAEERRRNSDRALVQAQKSNKIAIGSLVIAFASLVVAVIAVIQTGAK